MFVQKDKNSSLLISISSEIISEVKADNGFFVPRGSTVLEGPWPPHL
jgi:hypothetical protein